MVENKNKTDTPTPRFPFSLVLLAFLGMYLISERGPWAEPAVTPIPYSEFLKQLDEGKIASVTLTENELSGTYKAAPTKRRPRSSPHAWTSSKPEPKNSSTWKRWKKPI